MTWADLETPLRQRPRFFVQPPDGRRDWPELSRQLTLFKLMREYAPRVYGYAIPNAGKRNPRKARLEGIRAGVFDTHWVAGPQLHAYVELKGYDSRGRPGVLFDQQIDFGNRMVDLGVPVACFFGPHAAVDWLREQGFEIASLRDAA